ncbi:hypothetical protein [Collinsella stercoris]|uniref:hypothetical protein n=1 Tax=Collinsella stercoris TaxID=147206 RepID=UPI0023EF782D|nr:hypothetical protein [Collinsella stercoris]
MIIMELERMLHSPWLLVPLGIALALATASAIEAYAYLQNQYAQHVSFGYGLGLASHYYNGQTREGSFGNWIVVGANPTLSGTLFFYALPLLAVMPCAWSYLSERKSGYGAQVCIRSDRDSYLVGKCVAAFVSGALIAIVPLLWNFLLISCLLPAYFPLIEDVQRVGLFDTCFFSELFYSHPLLYVGAYTLLDALLMGAWAVAVMGVSNVTNDRVKLMVVPYLALFAWHYFNGWIFDTLAIQGFNMNLFNSLRSESTLSRPDFAATLVELACLVLFGILSVRALARKEAS